jgi:hypothetical protein
VIARALVGDRIAWSPPVEIVLDGAPPRVLSVGTTPPGEIASGQILEVRVKASDDALSGIERVEVGFDKDRVGRISGAPETAKLQPDGSWLATVSTGDLAVGPVNVLARAVDKVGIAGKFARAEIQILSSAAPPPAATQVVRGRVLYGSEAVSAAEVNFTDAEGAALPPTLSDARGNFESLPLPPGKYTVTARALKANKHRTAEAEVEVEPDAQTPPLELQIR